MDGDEPLWYILWALVAIFGVLTWYLRNFTQRVQATKLSALLGVVSMITLVTWTWTDF
jgi:CHASE2 domain-containing sensor protein